MNRKITCIVCPNGCEMTVETQNGKLNVHGAQCKRGREFAESEVTNPMRTIASSILILNGELPLASVRLNKPIPKSRIFEVMKEIKAVCLEAPVHIGDIVLTNVCGCNSDLIITKNVEQ